MVVIGVSRMIRIASAMVAAMRSVGVIGNPGDRFGIQRARLIGRGQDHFGRQREQRADHLIHRLVAHRPVDDSHRLAREELPMYAASARAPAGLCAPSRMMSGSVAMRSRRPGHVARAMPSLIAAADTPKTLSAATAVRAFST